ncbi:tRNA synthetases class I (M)-domain-containing protein [Daldinia loculata]|uniref:tRNA synthetases class I (M)-domain-containing protein n=1 Tax=Daldinia loculata TaxID=103429 RepID=UPI0020C4701E|nr:tRNA synthetases class I (M)-domain-containing protein [Daldinia loculata]KAI1645422.1 tRNA synthetases class I (M)-domain-containing protein [Daldinia loculata]
MGDSNPKPSLLPEPGKQSVLITSALPYANNVPHLGNIIGSVLSADVFARFCRARGLPTLYICGTDEYGTATETQALAEGVDPATLCSKYNAIHRDIYSWFKIDFDIFGRTPTPQHTEIVQEMFTRLWENGFIEQRETEQAYCPAHSSFLADRFVEGECSLCHAAGARGDQCDACGNLLDPLEPIEDAKAESGEDRKATGWLVNPRCKLDGATPERRKTKHLYLRLDALQPEIKSWLDNASNSHEWSSNAIAITQSWIHDGLKPRSITRDLKWGVPVPTNLPGLSGDDYDKKVFYVWFDACIGYPSITKCYTDRDDPSGKNWERWWKNPDNVSLYQFMGKDNVPFHSIIFPGSQLGTREKWTQVTKLSTTEYLNYEGGKFSKSKSVGVFGNSAKDTGVAVDVWRYYLLSRRPETSDSEFSWREFVDANNNDLLKNLGNFCNRVVKFCHAKLNAVVPDYRTYNDPTGSFQQHKEEVNGLLQTYITNLKGTKLRAGLSTVLSISALGNKLLQDNKLSNQLLSEDPERCGAVVGLALNHLHLIANIVFPYLPETANGILEQLGVQGSGNDRFSIPDTWTADVIPPGQALGEPKLLFTLIPTEKADEWREAFGGEELRKQKAIEQEKAAAKKAAKEKEKERKRLKKLGLAGGAKGESSQGQTEQLQKLSITDSAESQPAQETPN